MLKELLDQVSSLHEELKDLNSRYKKAERKETEGVTDIVKGSSKEFPYRQHNCVIQGIECAKSKHYRHTYKRQIKSKQHKLEKLINQIEYELNNIEDSEIRRIIRYKYEDNLNWIQVMFKMKYKSEDTARKKLERFLKKI